MKINFMKLLKTKKKKKNPRQNIKKKKMFLSLDLYYMVQVAQLQRFLLRLKTWVISFCWTGLTPYTMFDEHTDAISHDLFLYNFPGTLQLVGSV